MQPSSTSAGVPPLSQQLWSLGHRKGDSGLKTDLKGEKHMVWEDEYVSDCEMIKWWN